MVACCAAFVLTSLLPTHTISTPRDMVMLRELLVAPPRCKQQLQLDGIGRGKGAGADALSGHILRSAALGLPPPRSPRPPLSGGAQHPRPPNWSIYCRPDLHCWRQGVTVRV